MAADRVYNSLPLFDHAAKDAAEAAAGAKPAPDTVAKSASDCKLVTRRNGQPTIQDRWKAFHAANPDVFDAIRREATRERLAGWKRISINLIFEILRRDPNLQPKGGGDWKLDNTFRALYARELIRQDPVFDGLIETRE